MSDWLHVIEPMEEALGRMLVRAEPPDFDLVVAQPPLDGALPLLDEVLAPAADRLAGAEREAREADAVLEDAALLLDAWKGRLTALRDRLAQYDKPCDRPEAAPPG